MVLPAIVFGSLLLTIVTKYLENYSEYGEIFNYYPHSFNQHSPFCSLRSQENAFRGSPVARCLTVLNSTPRRISSIYLWRERRTRKSFAWVHETSRAVLVSSFGVNRFNQRNDMTFKVIRGQGQGQGSVKFAKMAEITVYFLCHLWGILNIVDDCDSTGQYLNFIEPDLSLSLSFSFYGTSNWSRMRIFTKFIRL